MRAILAPLFGLALLGAGGDSEVPAADPAREPEATADMRSLEDGYGPALLMPSYRMTAEQAELIFRAQTEGSDPLPPEDTETFAEAPAEGRSDPYGETCRDRIDQAREASGQPPLLRREPASPERPLAIYAVDREQDGCSVMVMMGDPEDIRPLPEVEQRPVFRKVPKD